MADPKRSHVDLIAGVLAGFIGLLALAVSIYGVMLQRQQTRAEVWPHLEVGLLWSGDLRGIRLNNAGVGPAIIKSVTVSVGEKAYRTWDEALHAVGADGVPKTYSHINGRVVSAGTEIDVLRINPGSPSLTYEQLSSLAVEICYCSVLEECWLLGREGETVSECPEPAGAFRN